MQVNALVEALPPAADALRRSGEQFKAGEIDAVAHHARAVQILEEASACHPYVAAVLKAKLEELRTVYDPVVAKTVRGLREWITAYVEYTVEQDQEHISRLGF